MAVFPIHKTDLLPTTFPSSASVESALTEGSKAEEDFCKSLPPLLVQARGAFQRDLPRLLRDCPQQWVAYRATGQVAGPHPSKTIIYQNCLQQGLQPGAFLLLAVSAESGPFLADVDL